MKYDNLEKVLITIAEDITNRYKSKIKDKAFASGKLYNSIDYKLEYTPDNIKIIFLAEDYWINVERGRAPNSKMPPVDKIKKWIIARGIGYKPGLEYKISRSIAKKGIKPKPFLRETLSEIQNYNNEIKEALNKDIQNAVKQ
jgi:hypothetical protein